MLAIIAGFGKLPAAALEQARTMHGDGVCVLNVKQAVPAHLDNGLQAEGKEITLTHWQAVVDELKGAGADRVLFCGKVDKAILFTKPDFDARAMGLIQKMQSQADMDIFHVMAEDLQAEGIAVVSQKPYLEKLAVDAGTYGSLPAGLEATARYGLEKARAVADLDIGQTLIAARQSIVAIEGLEGTDAAIERGLGLARDNDAVVCKVARSSQDWRFDVPAVGLSTLETIAKMKNSLPENGAGVTFALAFEKSLLVPEKDAFIERAAALSIPLIVI